MVIGSVPNSTPDPPVDLLPECQVSKRLDTLINELYALRDVLQRLARALEAAKQ